MILKFFRIIDLFDLHQIFSKSVTGKTRSLVARLPLKHDYEGINEQISLRKVG